jgi:hypothetical protein
MGYGVPKVWWDLILDGRLYLVSLAKTPFRSPNALQQMAYREGANRCVNVRTKRLSPGTMYVLAWGGKLGATWEPGIDVQLAQNRPCVEAPGLLTFGRLPLEQCNCHMPNGNHTSVCAIFGPGYQVKDPDDMSADCTCGQYPRCAPSCAVVTGSAGQLQRPQVLAISASDLADQVPATDPGDPDPVPQVLATSPDPAPIAGSRVLSQEALALMFPGLRLAGQQQRPAS